MGSDSQISYLGAIRRASAGFGEMARLGVMASQIHRANCLTVGWHDPICPLRGGSIPRVHSAVASIHRTIGCEEHGCRVGRIRSALRDATRPDSLPEDVKRLILATEEHLRPRMLPSSPVHVRSEGCDLSPGDADALCSCSFREFLRRASMLRLASREP